MTEATEQPVKSYLCVFLC